MTDSQHLPVRNPRSGEIDWQMPVCDAAAVADRAQRLREAQPAWQVLPLQVRLDALTALAAALQEKRAALLDAIARDTGRWHESVQEVDAVLGTVRRWCADAPALLAEVAPRPSRTPGVMVEQLRRPYPLVGIISPWNFPLLLSLIDAIPALAAGCAVLIKPSEVTPRFVPVLEAAIRDVPLLAGVVALVTGPGSTGEALVRNVDVLCFTGSVATGRMVGELAAQCFIPAHLELGGKDPAIVCADADVARTARALTWGSMVNAGQSCMSIERVYVHQDIADELIAALAKEVGALRHCYPDMRVGQIGPIISAAQVGIVQRHLDDAFAKGARAVTGGHIVNLGGGLWCEPTVLADASPEMAVVREETFAAILPVLTVASDEAAVRGANDTSFGLSACVFSADSAHARELARRLDAGAISINDAALTAVVHDAAKQSFRFSGLGGSRMGTASLTRFLRQQALLLGDSVASPWWFPAA